MPSGTEKPSLNLEDPLAKIKEINAERRAKERQAAFEKTQPELGLTEPEHSIIDTNALEAQTRINIENAHDTIGYHPESQTPAEALETQLNVPLKQADKAPPSTKTTEVEVEIINRRKSRWEKRGEAAKAESITEKREILLKKLDDLIHLMKVGQVGIFSKEFVKARLSVARWHDDFVKIDPILAYSKDPDMAQFLGMNNFEIIGKASQLKKDKKLEENATEDRKNPVKAFFRRLSGNRLFKRK